MNTMHLSLAKCNIWDESFRIVLSSMVHGVTCCLSPRQWQKHGEENFFWSHTVTDRIHEMVKFPLIAVLAEGKMLHIRISPRNSQQQLLLFAPHHTYSQCYECLSWIVRRCRCQRHGSNFALIYVLSFYT